MRRITRKLLAATRLVHVCCSMLAVMAIVFFAATGFMLNNEEMFGLDGEVEDTTVTATMPAEMVERGRQDQIVSYLRETFDVSGELEDFAADEYAIDLTFKRPGGRCDVSINRDDGEMEITTEPGSLVTVLVDLHRGEGAGGVWGALMDTAAVCLLVACLSGIILWLATPKRRMLGLIALALGLLAWGGAYLLYIPK